MPNTRFKSENYENFGGINKKASAYITDRRQVLNYVNGDFSKPGAWTMRPGTTQYFSATFASQVNYAAEYFQSSGFSQIMISNPGGLWACFGNSNFGISLGTLAAAATYAGRVLGASSFTQVQLFPGFSFAHSASFQADSVIYKGWYFQTDGRAFTKYNGTSIFPYGMPYGQWVGSTFGTTSGPGFTLFQGLDEALAYKIAYKNNRGVIGPIWQLGRADGAYGTGPAHDTVVANSNSRFIHLFLRVPDGFGISSILIYRSYGTGLVGNDWLGQIPGPYPLLAEIPAFGSSFVFVDNFAQGVNTTSVTYGTIFPGALEDDIDSATAEYPISRADIYRSITQVPIYSHIPRFLEMYANRLFMAGFPKNAASTDIFTYDDPENLLRFSEVDDAENVLGDNFIEIPSDGDVITGIKAFQSQLVIGKQFSIRALIGNSKDNFVEREVSGEYGLVNNRAICVFQDLCWFLDRKGIVQYNGANIGIISDDVEDYFLRMNYTVAIETACMLHVKERNEVWCAFPLDSSTDNNIVVIYDYEVKEWTVWEGFKPRYMTMIKGRNTKFNPMFGDFNGRFNEHGQSYMGDNGATISMTVQPRFEHPQGQSVEKMFRRLFLNHEKLVGGATSSFEIAYRANYQTAIGLTQTMVGSTFQLVSNFGLSAKSLSPQVTYNSATERIRIYGYTLEYRYQRST